MEGFLFVIIAMFVFMYLLLIRPQRQQQRRHQDLISNLKPGDEVITVGGLYGDVVGVEPDRVQLEIAEDVEVEVAKRAIASVVPPELEEEGDEGAGLEPVPEEPAAETEPPVAETETPVASGEDGGRR